MSENVLFLIEEGDELRLAPGRNKKDGRRAWQDYCQQKFGQVKSAISKELYDDLMWYVSDNYDGMGIECEYLGEEGDV